MSGASRWLDAVPSPGPSATAAPSAADVASGGERRGRDALAHRPCSFRRWSVGSGACSRAAARPVRTGEPNRCRSRANQGRARRVASVASPGSARMTWRCAGITHLSDEALVALVARGDESALGELYDRVGRVAYGIAYRILRDDRLAEDAVQEGFLAVWRSAAAFRAERAKASTWIVTLVHRRAVDIVRREERRRAEPLESESRADARRPDRVGRGRRLARLRARARAGRAPRAPRRAARGDRARLLRRLLAVRAGREARACRWVRSRAGCSPASRACASCWTRPNPRDRGRRDSRADRRLRARRARRRPTAPARRSCSRRPRRRARSFARSPRSPRRWRPPLSGPRLAPGCATGSSTPRGRSRRTSSRSSERRRSRLVPVSRRSPPRSPPCAALALGLWGASVSSDLDDARAALARRAGCGRRARRPDARRRRPDGRATAGSSSASDGRAVLVVSRRPARTGGQDLRGLGDRRRAPGLRQASSRRRHGHAGDSRRRHASGPARSSRSRSRTTAARRAPTGKPVIASAPVSRLADEHRHEVGTDARRRRPYTRSGDRSPPRAARALRLRRLPARAGGGRPCRARRAATRSR